MSFGGKVAVLGAIGAVSSAAWWYDFYSQVGQFVGAKGPLPIACLYQNGGGCGLVANVASWTGVTPYRPGWFVMSVVAMVVGTVMHLYAAVRDGMEPPPMPIRSRHGRTRDFN